MFNTIFGPSGKHLVNLPEDREEDWDTTGIFKDTINFLAAKVPSVQTEPLAPAATKSGSAVPTQASGSLAPFADMATDYPPTPINNILNGSPLWFLESITLTNTHPEYHKVEAPENKENRFIHLMGSERNCSYVIPEYNDRFTNGLRKPSK